MCVKIAALNKIRGFIIEKVAYTRCYERNISLFSMEEGLDISIKGNVLLCNYMRTEGPFHVVQFRTRALGRGINDNDVMEYMVARRHEKNGFVPYKNRINLLNEVLTLEDHEKLKG